MQTAPSPPGIIGFLNHLDRNVPAGLEIHLIADNYGTHKHAKVKAWLARHPRYHIHYTPTYASWLNQVERWFALITQQAIRRGSFRSVGELVRKIDAYVANYNLHRRPFVWTATADSILANSSASVNLLMGQNTRERARAFDIAYGDRPGGGHIDNRARAQAGGV